MAAKNIPPPAKLGGTPPVADKDHAEIKLRVLRWLDFQSSYRALRLLATMLTVAGVGALVLLIVLHVLAGV